MDFRSGVEFWLAREIQDLLGYATWDSFQPAIERAQLSCTTSGGSASNHFHQVTKMVKVGSGATRNIGDIALSRFAKKNRGIKAIGRGLFAYEGSTVASNSENQNVLTLPDNFGKE